MLASDYPRRYGFDPLFSFPSMNKCWRTKKNDCLTIRRVIITKDATLSLSAEQLIRRCPFVWIDVIYLIRSCLHRPFDTFSTVPRMTSASHAYSISFIKHFLSLSLVTHFNVSLTPQISPELPITAIAVVDWRLMLLFWPPRRSIRIRNVNWKFSCSSKTNEVGRPSILANVCSRNWLTRAKN